jgi:hypothetical protein
VRFFLGMVCAVYIHASAFLALHAWTFGFSLKSNAQVLHLSYLEPEPLECTPRPDVAAVVSPDPVALKSKAVPCRLDMARPVEVSDVGLHVSDLLREDLEEAQGDDRVPAPTLEILTLSKILPLEPASAPAETENVTAVPTPSPPVIPARGNGNSVTADSSEPRVDFFGIAAQAHRVVYVVDASQSMMGSPLNRACRQLEQSLRNLDPDQSFAIIFFGHESPAFPRSGELAFATEENTSEAIKWTKTVRARGGTRATDALARALRLRPQVVFFLSDGAIPRDLVQLARQTLQQGTVIHTVGLMAYGGQHSLRQLAESNRGVFRLVDE